MANAAGGAPAELREQEGAVSVIAPGAVYTPILSGQELTSFGETTPMRRASQPEEIAEVVAFLSSPLASYVTGATVAADGGRRAT